MIKKYLPITLLTVLILTGCTGKESESEINLTNRPSSAEVTAEETEKEDADETAIPEDKENLSFNDFQNLQFVFSSGAGGWGTYLNIHEDGSFSGQYSDSDMGDIGDGYPNGIRYESNFSGKFAEPVKVDDYIYSMKIEKLSYKQPVGTEEIKDGILYVYSDVYGLNGTEELLVYLPGMPQEELPEEYKNWVNYYLTYEGDGKTLSFVGLYNEKEQLGFSSYDLVESITEIVASTEAEAKLLQESIETENLSQGELNEKSQQLYETWDYTLNTLWDALKHVKDEKTMESLLEEQRAWIHEKEKAVKEAGAEVSGGSLQPLIENQKAAELTKERIYELLEYFNNPKC